MYKQSHGLFFTVVVKRENTAGPPLTRFLGLEKLMEIEAALTNSTVFQSLKMMLIEDFYVEQNVCFWKVF